MKTKTKELLRAILIGEGWADISLKFLTRLVFITLIIYYFNVALPIHKENVAKAEAEYWAIACSDALTAYHNTQRCFNVSRSDFETFPFRLINESKKPTSCSCDGWGCLAYCYSINESNAEGNDGLKLSQDNENITD